MLIRPCRELDRRPKFDKVFDDFLVAAAKFHADHSDRYAVLVFDNVDIHARDDSVRLRGFQELAKLAADKGLFKVIFVCSDGVALFKMRGEIPFSVVKFN
jgi:hypothetical protein